MSSYLNNMDTLFKYVTFTGTDYKIMEIFYNLCYIKKSVCVCVHVALKMKRKITVYMTFRSSSISVLFEKILYI